MPKPSTGMTLPAGLAVLSLPLCLGLAMFQATGDTRGVSLLPDVPVPVGNEMTEEKRVLGKILFYEEQLSADNTVACATCHTHTSGGADPRAAVNPGMDGVPGTEDDVHGSAGVIASNAQRDYQAHPVYALDPQVTNRAAPPVINAAFPLELFWDGRASDVLIDPDTGDVVLAGFAALENQALNPPLDAGEMGHPGRDWASIAAKLAHARPLALTGAVPPDMADAVLDARTYPELFRRAFGDDRITAVRIVMAIATYERTLIADQTPWDEFINNDPDAMTPVEQRGWAVFVAERCTICHIPPLFTNDQFRNIGLRPIVEDRGRQNVTGDPFDAGKFKVPGLRNGGVKATFMHNGEFTTTRQVVDFYADDDKFTENIDGFVQGININPAQRADLAAFLETGLTDPRVALGLFPFDSPDLFFSPATAPNPTLLADPGRPGSDGVVPRIIALTPPLIGADDFKIGLADVPEGATATLAVSTALPVAGMVPADELLGPFTATHPDGLGAAATAHWPIPFSPALDGRVYYMQWRVEDPALPEPALSPIARVELFCGFGDCATGCLADLNRDTNTDFTDVAAFLGAFNAQSPEADLAHPVGVFNFFDLQVFLNAYNDGCP